MEFRDEMYSVKQITLESRPWVLKREDILRLVLPRCLSNSNLQTKGSLTRNESRPCHSQTYLISTIIVFLKTGFVPHTFSSTTVWLILYSRNSNGSPTIWFKTRYGEGKDFDPVGIIITLLPTFVVRTRLCRRGLRDLHPTRTILEST